MTDALAAVRELHAPSGDIYPRCDGCDMDGFEADSPEWPCRTAQLVYTADEITTAVFAIAQRREQYYAEQRAKASTKETAGCSPLIPSVWQERIKAQLEQKTFLDRLRHL